MTYPSGRRSDRRFRRHSRLALWQFPLLLLTVALLAGCSSRPAVSPAGAEGAEESLRILTGQVVYTDGRGVDGAAVTAYGFQQEYLYYDPLIRRIGQVSTRADGGFTVRVPKGEDGVLLVAQKRGAAIGWDGWSAERPDRPIKIELAAPAVLAGRVVDEKGKPVGGAKVNAHLLRPGGSRRRGSWLSADGQIDPLVATTGADGRFRFDVVPSGGHGHFLVEADGHGRCDTFLEERGDGFPAGAENIELKLPPEAKVEAVVVEKQTGRPVEDVALFLISFGRGRYRLAEPVPGQKGHFRWTKLPPARCWVSQALPADGPAKWAVSSERVDARAGQTAQVKLEAVPGVILEVVVTDAASGEPVKGAYLSAWGRRGLQAAGRTGEDGVARIRAAPGEYGLNWVSAPRYEGSRPNKRFTVEDGKPARVEVTLEKAPRLHGVVRDGAGKPVAGAEISIASAWGSAATDEKGSFEIYRDFQEDGGGSLLLLARHEQRNLATTKAIEDPKQPVELTLQTGVAHDVEVLADDGEPLAAARVSVTIGRSDPDPPSGRYEKRTDGSGRSRIAAIPPGQAHSVRIQAEGYGAAERFFEAAWSEPGRVEKDEFRLRPVRRDVPAASVREIALREIPGGWAVWGATGRDERGHLWFGVTAHEVERPSAHLFEYVPETDTVVDRGDVVSELRRAGVLREGEQQMKIHTKIVQVSEYLYFASMDEKGEDERKGVLPVYGGHLWRLRLKDNRWEHLLTTQEALIALAAGGKKVYTLGYWDHVLYQYDTETGKTRSVKVGALVGHVSRNIIADSRGHVYVPRVTAGAAGPAAALAEYDASLVKIGETPLPFYFHGQAPRWSHGITGLQPLPDGSIAFLTHNGYLSLIRPESDGEAKVTGIGWFHPDGPGYAASLFTDDSGRFLMGAVGGGWDRAYEWVVYDLKTNTHSLAEFNLRQPKGLSLRRTSLYGSQTRDGAGNCYVAGVAPRGGRGEGSRPIVLQVVPGKIEAEDAAGGE